MKPNIGIIGCGEIFIHHYGGLKKFCANVVHICDVDEERARPYVDYFKARYSRDYHELINNPEVTAVCIFTGSFLHKEMAIAALKAGKDVICEKTMTISAAQAEEVVRATKESGRIFITGYMKRFFPAYDKAKALIPKLGKIFHAHIRSYQPWGNLFDRDQIPEDRLASLKEVRQRNGSVVLMCSGSHMIDLMLSLLGRPKSVYASVDYIEGTDLDRRVNALFEYDGSMVVHFDVAANNNRCSGYERNGWDEFVKIIGTEGMLEFYTVTWNKSENNGILLVHYDNATGTRTEYCMPLVNAFHLEVEAYLKALEERKQIHPDVIDGFAVDNIIEAIFESSREKMPVIIDWKGF